MLISIEKLSYPVCIINISGQVVNANKHFLSITGLSNKSLLKEKSISSFFTPESSVKIQDLLKKVAVNVNSSIEPVYVTLVDNRHYLHHFYSYESVINYRRSNCLVLSLFEQELTHQRYLNFKASDVIDHVQSKLVLMDEDLEIIKIEGRFLKDFDKKLDTMEQIVVTDELKSILKQHNQQLYEKNIVSRQVTNINVGQLSIRVRIDYVPIYIRSKDIYYTLAIITPFDQSNTDTSVLILNQNSGRIIYQDNQSEIISGDLAGKDIKTLFNKSKYDYIRNCVLYGKDIEGIEVSIDFTNFMNKNISQWFSVWGTNFYNDSDVIDGNELTDGVYIIFLKNIQKYKIDEGKHQKRDKFLEYIQKIGQIGGWEFSKDMGMSWTDQMYRIHEIDFNHNLSLKEMSLFKSKKYQDIINEMPVDYSGDKEFDIESEIITDKNKKVYIRAIGQIYYDKGEIIRSSGVLQDITSQRETQIMLNEEQVRFKSTFEKSPLGMVIVDSEDLIIKINDTMFDLMKYSSSEFAGMHHKDLLKDKKTIEEIIQDQTQKSIIDSNQYGVAVKYIDKRGTILDVILSINIIDNKTTFNKVYYIIHVQDITYETAFIRAVSDSEERFRAAFENSPIGMALVEPNGMLTQVNDRFAKMLDYPKSELQTLSYQSVTYPDDLVQANDYIFRLIGGEMDFYQIEIRYLKKNKDVLWVLLNVSILRDQNNIPVNFVFQIADISDMKKLINEYDHVTKDLMRSNSELEQFAYIASHDLQEPIRVISNYIGLIQKRYSNKLDDDGQEFMKYVVDNSKRIQVLINDLLVYSRVGRHGYSETVDLNQAMETALQNLKVSIAEASAKINYPSLPSIKGDMNEMIRLIQNLIGNSVKFRNGRTPIIDISIETNTGFHSILIRDNGIGIEEQYFEKIFLIFQRLHAGSEYEGTGVGLALCKRIVESHGGRIGVKSKVGEGLTFWFTLPVLKST